MKTTIPNKPPTLQNWHTLSNLRTDLLHLQYLHATLHHNITLQTQHLNLHHKDRLIQLHNFHKQYKQICQSNWKILLIVKLQSLIGIYQSIDQQIEGRLRSFMDYVGYIQEELGRDLGRVYVGHKTMVDIQRCEKEVREIQGKILKFLGENRDTILLYNRKLEELQQLKQYATNYIQQIRLFQQTTLNSTNYRQYLSKKLKKEHQKTEQNITHLKSSILQ